MQGPSLVSIFNGMSDDIGVLVFVSQILLLFAAWVLKRKLERYDALVEEVVKLQGEHAAMMKMCPAANGKGVKR